MGETVFKPTGIRKADSYFSVFGLIVVLTFCREHFIPHSPSLLPSASSLKSGTRLS